MDSYLIINLNSEPKRLDVFAIDDSKVDHLESCLITESIQASATDNSAVNGNSFESTDALDSEQTSETSAAEDSEAVNSLTAALKTAIETLKNKWSSSAVIYSPKTYYSFNINLPFNDEKTISRVLNAEIEDRLSFETDGFIIDHKVVGQLKSGEYDVHIAFADKQELQEVINACNACGVDPVAVTPTATIATNPLKNESNLSEDCSCFIHILNESISISFQVYEQLRSDRSFKISKDFISDICSEIKRSIIAAENRYQVSFNRIYLFSENNLSQDSEDLPHQALISAIEQDLSSANKTISRTDANQAELIANALSGSKGANDLFVNFRTGDLAKVLSLSNIWQIFKPFVPYLLLSLFLVSIALAAYFYNKETEINNLQAEINSKSAKILGLNSISGNQLNNSIQLKIQAIEKQLGEIGSPSKFSPLEILSELSKDMSIANLPKLVSLSIKSSEFILTVSSDSFEAIEPIEKILNSKKNFYCGFERKDSGSGTREFVFTVKLCE